MREEKDLLMTPHRSKTKFLLQKVSFKKRGRGLLLFSAMLNAHRAVVLAFDNLTRQNVPRGSFLLQRQELRSSLFGTEESSIHLFAHEVIS